jgi:phosphohistidine phosphatase
MQLYILRHGAADERPGIADEERGLTEEGRRQIAGVAASARTEGAEASLVLTSPLRRARETAQIAAAVWGGSPEFLETPALLPDAEPHEVWDEIRMHRNQPQVLLAAHEPLLGRLVAFLLNAPSALIDMRRGSLARVDVDHFSAQPQGILRWLITPGLVKPNGREV